MEERPGELVELVVGKRKQVLATDKANLWAQLATYALDHAKPGGKPQGRAAHLYKEITGNWPPREWKVDAAPRVDPTAATLNKIRSLYTAFSRRAS